MVLLSRPVSVRRLLVSISLCLSTLLSVDVLPFLYVCTVSSFACIDIRRVLVIRLFVLCSELEKRNAQWVKLSEADER